MNEKLISVVVPIYKVEKYLATCIDSILRQTHRHLELILVDDGSPDRCPRICDEYKTKDSRVKVIHKPNGGLSDARNAGLEIAQGKWITFVDSDDYVDENFLKVLYEAAINTDAEISICDYRSVSTDNEKETEETVRQTFNRAQCFEEIYHPRFHGMEFVAWGKLYQTKLFKENGIRYPFGKIHEDIFTTYKLIYAAKSIAFSNAVEYFYRQREGSIMARSFNLKRLDILEATREACQFFEKKGETALLGLAVNAHLRNYIFVFSEMKKNRKNITGYQLEANKLKEQYQRDFRLYSSEVRLSLPKRVYYSLFYYLPGTWFARLLK